MTAGPSSPDGPRPRSPTTRAHLVLGSGGVRCLAFIGALEGLEEEGYEFATVSTCSAGTFVGALYCAGVPPAAMREAALTRGLGELAGDVRWKALRRLWTLRSWPYALYREPGMPRVFGELLRAQGLQPDPTLGDLRIPMATAAVDVGARRLLVYSSETNATMRVTEVLRIATAIPLMYEPHTDTPGDREVLDAALASYIPIWLATGQSDDLPIVVLGVAAPAPKRRKSVLPWKAALPWISDVVASGIASRDTFDLERVPEVTHIDIATGVSAFDFGLSRVAREALIDKGREAVAERFERREERGLVRPSSPASDDDRAEAQATTLFRKHIDKAARPTTATVFLSYAREDRDWVRRLRAKLRPVLIRKDVTVWDDSYIAPGASWDEAIRDAIDRARVAVLFVSGHFRTSEYAIGTELKLLRERRGNGLVRVLWVSVDGAMPDDPEDDLQAAYDPARPLAKLDDAALDAALHAIGRLVEEELERSAPGA